MKTDMFYGFLWYEMVAFLLFDKANRIVLAILVLHPQSHRDSKMPMRFPNKSLITVLVLGGQTSSFVNPCRFSIPTTLLFLKIHGE